VVLNMTKFANGMVINWAMYKTHIYIHQVGMVL